VFFFFMLRKEKKKDSAFCNEFVILM